MAVVLDGAANFRARLVLSTLSGRTLRLENIRTADESPGLRDYEVNFLRLLEKMTNGSHIEIGHTGTSMVYQPGVIKGGTIEHECCLSRGIGWYLEPLLALAPFGKLVSKMTLYGITNDAKDSSVDIQRTVSCKLLCKFGIDNAELKIKKRGCAPLGGGEVYFSCPIVSSVPSVHLEELGRVKKIRGIAVATRVSPQTANRLVESARSVLNRFIPDIYIYTDVYKGADSGKSPGYALSLVAESTEGILTSAELNASSIDSDQTTPEDIGVATAKLLLHEIQKGGCIDTAHQWLALLFAGLSAENISKIRLAQLSSHAQRFVNEAESFLGVAYRCKRTHSGFIVSCVGCGYQNYSRRTQ